MALPYVCPKVKAKVLVSGGAFFVVANEEIVAKFDRISPAKTFAKRWNSLWRWLGQSSLVYASDFNAAVATMLTIAGSGDGRYRPPLTLV